MIVPERIPRNNGMKFSNINEDVECYIFELKGLWDNF